MFNAPLKSTGTQAQNMFMPLLGINFGAFGISVFDVYVSELFEIKKGWRILYLSKRRLHNIMLKLMFRINRDLSWAYLYLKIHFYV